MTFRTLVFTFALYIGVTTFIVQESYGQSFDFKTYDSSVGLPQNFVYTLAEAKNGYLWIGTGEGVVKYDGVEFHKVNLADSITDEFVRTIKLANDGAVWVGLNNGIVSIIGDSITNLYINPLSSNSISDFTPYGRRGMWVLMQNGGIARVNDQKVITDFSGYAELQDFILTDIETQKENELLVGTNSGLYQLKIKDNQISSMSEVKGIPASKINRIVPRKSSKTEYWIATEEAGFYLYNSANGSATQVSDQKMCLQLNIRNENIQSLVEEDNGDLLLATWGDGVIKLFYDKEQGNFVKSLNFSTANGLNNNYIKDILCDVEGNYWFGTYGGGISSLIDGSFIFYSLEDIGFKQNKVLAVYAGREELWMGLENGLLKSDPYCFLNHEYYDKAMGVPNDKISGFVEDREGNLWVSTFDFGVYFRKSKEIRFRPYSYCNDAPGKKVNDIKISGDSVLLATMGGLYVIDIKRNTVELFNTLNGLPHNNINFVYADSKKNIWIGPKNSGVCKITSEGIIEKHMIFQTPVNVAGLVEDLNGILWLATIGKGVVRYDENGVYEVTTNEGLAKNYCYSINCDKNNRLWVSHWPGISSIDVNTMQIKIYGGEHRMSGDFYNIWQDHEKHLWFASSEGVVKYFPELDKKNLVPPRLNFSSIKISGKSYPITESITLPYPYRKSKYQFRFDFIGISFKNPRGVTYQYQLIKNDDYESAQWIDLGSSGYREFDFLPDGQYELRVTAVNADGVRSKTNLSLTLNIEPPLWKQSWFYLLMASLFAYLIYMLIKYREQRLREAKRVLESEVANQTVLLRHQKTEIERKNQDITDSINYAKRIQSSILPPIGNLNEWFSDSFVFFAPRDIVSGDFYWFNHKEGKFYICCVDCTGHGVPGAFMSMIGSTLLTDIFKRKDAESPAKILLRLDEELKILLHQGQGGDDQSKDGMDISIVEIAFAEKKIRVSAARRPVYLYLNNEFVIFNGTRRSIGEYQDKEFEKEFTFEEYTYKHGDIIYLFSDGYTDQFGGPQGKKFMTVGFKNLLQGIMHLPMSEQLEIVEKNFYDWKGDLDQVDDVIVMGIKF